MANERPNFGGRAVGGNGDSRLLASLPGNAVGMIGGEPFASSDKARQSRRESRDEDLTCRRRKAFPRQQRLANGREMAKPFNDAIHRKRGKIDTAILHHRQASFGGPD